MIGVFTHDYDGGYTEIEYEESNTTLGYKFISNGGGMTFAPFIGFETIPTRDESLQLKSYDGKYGASVHPTSEISKVGINFGFQWGFLF